MVTANKSTVLEMTGSDVRMDHVSDNSFEVANPLPVKCTHCTFPDIDHVANPFKLAKKYTSPIEMAPSDVGNFLVKDRIRIILEKVIPGSSTFYPTITTKNGQSLEWWLAVPKAKLAITKTEDRDPFCSKCMQPKTRSRAMDTDAGNIKQLDNQGHDIFKSKEWYCSLVVEDEYNKRVKYWKEQGKEAPPISNWGIDLPQHQERWTRKGLDVYLFFSVRLDELLKRLKVKSDLVRCYNFRDVKPTAADEAWIAEKIQLLVDEGLLETKKKGATKSSNINQWFDAYINSNSGSKVSAVDWDSIETKFKVKLPETYKAFVTKVGSKKFKDIEGNEGSVAKILLPKQLDFVNYRKNKLPENDEGVDGVMFADTEHGDCFLFDVARKGKDYPVYWYDHEQNVINLFADSFSKCIQRFVEKN